MGNESFMPSLSALLDREADNNKRIAELKAELDKREFENKRIADALSLMREMGIVAKTADETETENETPKTMPDKIVAAIKRKGVALTAPEVIEIIRTEWIPDVDPNHVRPTLWRMTEASRLKKRGDRYDLP